MNINKEVKGLAKYVGEHILPVLKTVECQTIKDIIECLEKIYGRTRLEKLGKLMLDWMNFKDDDYNDEDDLLLAKE